MMDPNLQDFYARVARLEKAHSKGMGFEAPGAIGRSHYRVRRRRSIPLLRPVLAMVIAVTLLKATILFHTGPEAYTARVDVMKAGAGFDRLGGILMTADPVSIWLADQLRIQLPRLRNA